MSEGKQRIQPNGVDYVTGYNLEDKVLNRNSNGWGGEQTRLPKGHLARRDEPAMTKKYLSDK